MAKKGIKEAMRAANREGGKGIQPALAAIVGLGKRLYLCCCCSPIIIRKIFWVLSSCSLECTFDK